MEAVRAGPYSSVLTEAVVAPAVIYHNIVFHWTEGIETTSEYADQTIFYHSRSKPNAYTSIN